MTQSALVTLEHEVLGRDHEVIIRKPVKRRVRQSYEWPNGSELVVAGLDDPGKTLSTQYDFCYIMEVTEEGVTFDAYETLLRSLRNGQMPYHQMLMDCNPTTPTHWVYKRQQKGMLTMFSSSHKDNPAYWDRVANEYTPLGLAYVQNTLGRMSGTRRSRFFLGEWRAAEGLVYDGYCPSTHDMLPGWAPPRDWPRVWGIDWGFTNPTALIIMAFDGDGRIYIYKEFYKTHTRAEELARWAKAEVESGREPLPVGVLCDHDPECAATFRLYGPPGIAVTMADKADKLGGIEATQERLDVQEDGRPRLFFVPGMTAHSPDAVLEDAGKPTGLLSEIIGYVWDTSNPDRLKDEPLDRNNHACDGLRYAVRWIDKYTQVVPASENRPKLDLFGRLGKNTWA